jgi:O-antigen ligase
MLFHITTLVFKKKHIEYYLNMVLWFTVLNIAYMIVQTCGMDRMFVGWKIHPGAVEYIVSNDPSGFMMFKGGMGMLAVIAQAILLPRPGKWAKVAGLLMVVPIWISRASICLIASAVLIGFNFWQLNYYVNVFRYRIHRGYVLAVASVLMTLGVLFFAGKVDNMTSSFKTRVDQWSILVKDCSMHPITGWGLDSFRVETGWKPFRYCANYKQEGKDITMDVWDNPHNLYLSLVFEWGIIGLLIVIGYFRQLVLWFQRSDRSRDVLALGGVLLGVAIISLAHFPMFLSRLAVIVIPIAALFEVATRKQTEDSNA